MKIPLNQEILNLTGEPLPGSKINTKLTIREVIINGLLHNSKGEILTGVAKLERFNMALRVQECLDDSIQLNTEEIIIIKEQINKVYSTIVYGRAASLIEGGE